MKKKIVIGLLAIAIIVVALCTIGEIIPLISENKKMKQTEEDPVELSLVCAFQNQQWNDCLVEAVTRFEKEYPEIKINLNTQYQDNVYEDALNQLLARDEMGDIVQMKTPDAYQACGALAPIDASVANLSDTLYEADGQIYGVGAIAGTSGIIYNKKLFRNAGLDKPQNYEEFLRICSKLKWRGITPLGVAGSELWHLEFWMNHFFRTDVLSKSPNWLAECEAGIVHWTDPEPVAMLTHLQELFGDGYQNSDWGSTSEINLAYRMSKQEIAMVYAGPFMLSAIQSMNPNVELGWFYVPDEDGKTYSADTRDVYWSVTKSCASDEKKYQAAMEFLTFFFSEDMYPDVLAEMNGFSTAKSIGQNTVQTNNEDAYEAYLQTDVQIRDYIGDKNTPQGFETQMLLVMKDVMGSKITPQDAATQIQSIWDQCMKEER